MDFNTHVCAGHYCGVEIMAESVGSPPLCDACQSRADRKHEDMPRPDYGDNKEFDVRDDDEQVPFPARPPVRPAHTHARTHAHTHATHARTHARPATSRRCAQAVKQADEAERSHNLGALQVAQARAGHDRQIMNAAGKRMRVRGQGPAGWKEGGRGRGGGGRGQSLLLWVLALHPQEFRSTPTCSRPCISTW